MAVILTKRRGEGSSSSSYINLWITNELADGIKNNTNKVFGTTSDYVNNTLEVFYNGQKLIKDNDYREQGSNVFKLIYVKPHSNDNLSVNYQIPN